MIWRKRCNFIYVAVEGVIVIIQWLKGEKVDPKMLRPEYGRMFAENDWLVEIR